MNGVRGSGIAVLSDKPAERNTPEAYGSQSPQGYTMKTCSAELGFLYETLKVLFVITDATNVVFNLKSQLKVKNLLIIQYNRG